MKYPPPPSQQILFESYNLIQSKKLTAHKFTEIFEWSRFDPRLAKLLVLNLKDNWSSWNPLEINKLLKFTTSPAVLKILAAHVVLLLKGQERKFFNSWIDCCFYQVETKKDWSTFYIGHFGFGSPLLKEETFEAIPLFTKWGYYAKTPIIDFSIGSRKQQRTLIPKSVRLKKLKQLLKLKKKIRVHDYIVFLEHKISRRTAELDIKSIARKIGNTKGSIYHLR